MTRLTGFLIASVLLVLSAPLASAQPAAPQVRTGIDVLVADNFAPLAGKRVGLITNPTGLTADLKSTVDVLQAAPGVKLVALYGPEHGVRGDAHAGDHVDDARDPKTNLPLYSLYGETRKPTPEMLQGVEVLVYDIQDIGSRSYTFISTLAVAMEAAAENGIALVVLDRPNPLGGVRIEGRPLDLAFRSFVGQLPIPYVHGLTVGELAQMINGEGWSANAAKCELRVIPMKNWKRSMLFADTGLVWVPPSPHVPRAESSAFYAATGILGELGVINEGVGFPLPFELLGAPRIDATLFADALNARKLPGVVFRPMYYRPFYGSCKDEPCGGVQVLLTDPRRVHLTSIQFHAMDIVRERYPDLKLFGNERDEMFDKVCGTDEIRKMFLDGKPLAEILKFWNEGVDEFRAKRVKYLLYE
jgi:uncharacterized protein YbbC (DUF1343 family)